MRQNLTFSVAISTYDRNDDLIKCLTALSAQTYKDFDVVIVSAGETEAVRKISAGFNALSIKVIGQEKKGVVEARNLGWRNSEADIVCFIDDDLVVSQAWLEQIRNTFLSGENIGGVSGPTLIPEDRLKKRDLAQFLDIFKNSHNIFIKLAGQIYLKIILENKIQEVGKILDSGAFTPGSNYPSCLQLTGPVEVDYLEACHMCFRRFLLEKIGGFDYSYTGTGEWNEPDFSFRVRKFGYRLIFNPLAITEHHISQGGVFKARTYAYERSRNFIYFYFKNVKLNKPGKLFRFGLNLLFINSYWIYKFIQTGNINWMLGLWGTVRGIGQAYIA